MKNTRENKEGEKAEKIFEKNNHWKCPQIDANCQTSDLKAYNTNQNKRHRKENKYATTTKILNISYFQSKMKKRKK